MRKSNLTYRKSGVNIKAADKFVNYIFHLYLKNTTIAKKLKILEVLDQFLKYQNLTQTVIW